MAMRLRSMCNKELLWLILASPRSCLGTFAAFDREIEDGVCRSRNAECA